MDDADILPLRRTEWDAASAARRIAQLETALMRRGEQLEQAQAALDDVKNSGAWTAVRWYYKIRERLLPLHSRRRRAVRTALRATGRLVKRLTGRDPADPDGGGRDRVALDTLQYARWIARHEPT